MIKTNAFLGMKFARLILANLALISLFFIGNAFAADVVFEKGKRPTKDITRDPLSKGPTIVDMAKIKPDMIVADVFGGSGYYSEIISHHVGKSGKVYLHNNQAYLPYVEKELIARLANNRLPNVERFDREAEDLNFPNKSLDAIFYILGYHDLYHTVEGWHIEKAPFLKRLKAALKQGGKLIIVDHSAVAGSKTKHSQELHRIDKKYVIDELTAEGFTLQQQSNVLANPKDNRMSSPFLPEMRRKTDRFVLIFTKN